MLETEYFSCGHHNDDDGGDDTMGHPQGGLSAPHQLAERTPVVLVALPAATRWYREVEEVLPLPSSTTSRDLAHPSKRVKVSHEAGCGGGGGGGGSLSGDSATSDAAEVLAKFYSEQYPEHRKLRLNQIVEVVGVLERPTEDSDQGVQDDIVGTDEAMILAQSSMMGDCEAALVPSHVPRLHVVWFRTVSLDGRRPRCVLSSSPPPVPVLPALTRALSLSDAVSRAVWMLLQSKAERDGSDTAAVTPHQDRVLGCASLNLIVNDGHSNNSAEAAVERLRQALQCLVPVLRVVSVTPEALDGTMAPRKVAGRLHSGVLQLPAGSVLLLDARHLPRRFLSPQRVANLQLLQGLCRQHQLPYTFDGGVSLPFEADYRIVVLSTPATHELLPCTLTVQWNGLSPCALPTGDDDDLAAVRDYLQRCRGQHISIGLDPAVLAHAQQDFLQRRAADRAHAGEADFHRWLTLCRLHARSRNAPVADVTDWTSALALDDAMQGTMQQP